MKTLDKTTIMVSRIEDLQFVNGEVIMKYKMNRELERLFITKMHRFEFKCPDIAIVQACIMQENGKERRGLENRVKQSVLEVVRQMMDKRLCILT